ncbi:MAG: hypothetical protein HQL32_04805 [Planctomycetes bacterium]|nr:hypothetical protein [Planctomycetota bacterium]
MPARLDEINSILNHLFLLFKVFNSLAQRDPIFDNGKRKSPALLILLLILIGASLAYLYHLTHDGDENIAPANQVKALEHIETIIKAVQKWKKNDYDANGKNDYPLKHLNQLVHTSFINGSKLELIDQSLGDADLRNFEPIALDGYFFTLTCPLLDWPTEALVPRIAVLAVPQIPGETGICSFYIDPDGQGYYCPYDLKEKVPPWPSSKLIREEIWKKLPDM